jgi:hypothetical protein
MWKSLPIMWIKENKIGVKPLISVPVLERISQIARTGLYEAVLLGTEKPSFGGDMNSF